MNAISGTETNGAAKSQGLFDILGMRMDYLKQRQSVVAQNVANADAPGYKANDLVPFATALKGVGVKPVDVAVTDAAHIQPGGRRIGGNYGDTSHSKTSYETLPTGNNVVLEEQMMKVAQINNDYQLVTSLYKDANSMMKMALGRSNA